MVTPHDLIVRISLLSCVLVGLLAGVTPDQYTASVLVKEGIRLCLF